MIEKLDFKNAKTISEDFEVIENKINEIIDVVNKISNETGVYPIEIKATIGDLKVIKSNSDDLKANEISKEKLNLNMDTGGFSVSTNWTSYLENKVSSSKLLVENAVCVGCQVAHITDVSKEESSIINKDGYIKMSVIKENLK